MKNIFLIPLILLCTNHVAYTMIPADAVDIDTEDSALHYIKFHKIFGADINARYTGHKKEYQNMTALEIACHKGYPDVVAFLLDSSTKYYREHPLLIAVKKFSNKKHRDVTRLLIALPRMIVNACNDNNQTALYIASEHNNIEAVEELLDHPNIQIDQKDTDNNTPLHTASDKGHIDIVRLLIAKKADINAQNKKLKTPLYCASSCGHLEVVRLLLASGANPGLADKNGNTPLHKACEKDHVDVVDILLQNNPLLLNTRNQCGSTPLHIALQRKSSNVVPLLLTHPAIAVYATDDNLQTPLHYACENGNVECARLLLRKDFEGIDMQDNKGYTALHIACKKDDMSTIKLLMEEGANPTIKNNEQLTPLAIPMHKFENLDPVIAQQMISATDEYQNTQLHLCAVGEHYSKSDFQFFTKRGISVWVRNKDDKIAADVACHEYHRVLQQYYAKKTPLMKSMLDKQEQIMHSFLRITSAHTSCATFKQMFTQSGLLPEIQKPVMHYFYKLNIETIVARTYRDNNSYYDLDIHKKNKIRKALESNPENPHLLWRDAK